MGDRAVLSWPKNPVKVTRRLLVRHPCVCRSVLSFHERPAYKVHGLRIRSIFIGQSRGPHTRTVLYFAQLVRGMVVSSAQTDLTGKQTFSLALAVATKSLPTLQLTSSHLRFAGAAIPKGRGDFRGGAGGRVRGSAQRRIHACAVVQDGAQPPALRLRVAGGGAGEVFSHN